jgi:hypothetical protein
MAVLGILLMVIGAVLLWGVDVFTSGVNLHAIGVIFLVLGAISFVAGLVTTGGLGFGTRSRTERHVSGDGRHVVEESSFSDF